ncbi:MAG: hypothetical protein VX829_12385 [Pseudomonadota bacterium]|jgi:hypothetical protein|uniref:condensin complex protein MksE n=1 Tax=Methylophaga thalassica TaxID=40223 RepID=UPI002E7AC813|nr:hypothetical protein [Methylophaga thalassica]MEC9413458.1 hypothetical protein [Pseudomonadota bacterium]WVI83931.1 hypothetical protein VSX76_00845 [Methylophaga thalassica]
MADFIHSKAIFEQLMNGQVINRHVLENNSELNSNPLFDEIIQFEDEYRRQYRMSGYQLEVNENYILLQNTGIEADSLKTDASMKVYVLLLLIAKYLNTRNYKTSKIEPMGSGLTHSDISLMEELPDIRETLDKADMKKSLLSHIKSTLVERNIMLEKVGSDAYVLSDAGNAFFQEIFAYFYDNV